MTRLAFLICGYTLFRKSLSTALEEGACPHDLEFKNVAGQSKAVWATKPRASLIQLAHNHLDAPKTSEEHQGEQDSTDCEKCVATFEASSGCEAVLAGKENEARAAVPAGCDHCGDEAMRHCQAKAKTLSNVSSVSDAWDWLVSKTPGWPSWWPSWPSSGEVAEKVQTTTSPVPPVGKDENELGPDRSVNPGLNSDTAADLKTSEKTVSDNNKGEIADASPAAHVTEISDEPVLAPPSCLGVEESGRCWYLSAPGDNCISTCLAHGRAFRFGVPSKTMVSQLLGFEPAHVGGPWTAFDVYNVEENRSRRYSSCSANDYRDKDGTWSNPKYRLACPCGGVKECFWKQAPSCEAVFVFRGIRHSGCVKMANRGDPWCQHDHDNEEGWSHCVQTCIDGSTGRIAEAVQSPPLEPRVMARSIYEPPDAPTQTTTQAPRDDDECMWALAPDCWPEFEYGPDHLVGCTRVDHHTPWCSKTKKFNHSWTHCIFTCPEVTTLSMAKEVKEQNFKASHEAELCTWKIAKKCVKQTTYLGVEYEGCIRTDAAGDTPWCSKDAVHKGEWANCEHDCSKAADEDL